MSISVFISTVSDEFRAYRDQLIHDLTRHNVAVKVQEDFKGLGNDTLDKLDVYIAHCEAVVHLVGEMTGAFPGEPEQQALIAKHPNLPDRLASLGEALAQRKRISYTQWEAWLALYHAKRLFMAKAEPAAPRGPRFAPTDQSRAEQEAHLTRLQSARRYPDFTFRSEDELAKHVLGTAILDLLVADYAREVSAARDVAEGFIKEMAAPVIPPVRCFGRDADVATLVAALAAPEPAALLVLGPPGIGKTTLTRRVATDAVVVARFAARRWFVELETANDAATLRTAIIQAIGLNPAATTFAAALAWLARQPCLLVLDNLETPWEQDQRAVHDSLQMLAVTVGVSLLASLRGGAVPPSPRWTRPPTKLRRLPEDEVRRLFLELASGIAADDPHLARFLEALSGVPLAVELDGARPVHRPASPSGPLCHPPTRSRSDPTVG